MKSLLIDTRTKEVRVVNPAGLEDYYNLIGCDLVDIVTRRIGRKVYEVICDDEGTFCEDPLISAIDDLGRVMFVGSLIITGKVDDEGELTDLTANDIRYIKKRVQHMPTRLHDDLLILTNCNY